MAFDHYQLQGVVIYCGACEIIHIVFKYNIMGYRVEKL